MKRNIQLPIFLCFVSLFFISCAEKEIASTPAPDFSQALNTHLESIISKNLATFESTLSRTAPLHMIFPDGERVTNVDTIVSLHREWFAGKEWKFDYEIVRIEESSEMALALLDIDYHKKDDAGNDVIRQFYLNLVFKLIDGEWKLIHDQNTDHS